MSDWHSEETYKGLILLSQGALKFGPIVNGGASIALLALLGDLYGKSVDLSAFALPMYCFVIGISLSGLAYATSYLTQLRLYNSPQGNDHTIWLYGTILLVLSSIVLFLFGAALSIGSLTTGT